MSDVLELAALALAARHADEQAVLALDDLDVVDHEAPVENDRDESADLFVTRGIDPDVGDLHVNSPPAERPVHSGVAILPDSVS